MARRKLSDDSKRRLDDVEYELGKLRDHVEWLEATIEEKDGEIESLTEKLADAETRLAERSAA